MQHGPRLTLTCRRVTRLRDGCRRAAVGTARAAGIGDSPCPYRWRRSAQHLQIEQLAVVDPVVVVLAAQEELQPLPDSRVPAVVDVHLDRNPAPPSCTFSSTASSGPIGTSCDGSLGK